MQVQKISFISFGMRFPVRKKEELSQEECVSFGYRDKLKDLFKKGKLPTVTRDVGGNKLTIKNVTLDHVIPKSRGGVSATENYMLATAKFNHSRGNLPLSDFLTKDKLEAYLDQFVDVFVDGFDGNRYIKDLMKTLKKAKRMGV